MSFFFFLFFSTSLSPVGNSGRLTWVRLQQQQEQRYPFLSVCVVFKSSATHSYQCVQYSRAALPIPISVCSIQEQRYPFLSVYAVFSLCPNNGMAASVGDFFTCPQMLMNAIAHEDCTDTVRESALKDELGKKILCRTWNSNPRQYCAWRSSIECSTN